MGDLSYYSDILGKPNISPHWCHLCDMSHKEWNDGSNLNVGNLWNIEMMKGTLNSDHNHTTCEIVMKQI